MGAATSQIAYTASKGGVLAMSRELGVHFAREGIRVNALSPGPVNTPLLQELFANDKERAARRLVHIPMGCFADASVSLLFILSIYFADLLNAMKVDCDLRPPDPIYLFLYPAGHFGVVPEIFFVTLPFTHEIVTGFALAFTGATTAMLI